MLGLIIKEFDLSDAQYYMTINLNRAQELENGVSPAVFRMVPGYIPHVCKFGVFELKQAYGFTGPLMVFDANCVKTLKNMPSTNKKYFYVWDLEWLYINQAYEENVKIYQDDSIELIARSKPHYDLLSKCWKNPVGIVEDFNYEQLNKIIKTS